ncbi:MAG: guanylate kinase [candidate division WOR-3 bacterium]
MNLKNVDKKPLIFILTGPSGSGKTTIRKELQKRFKDFFISVSATTRERRKGERNGLDYIFLTQSQFRQWQKEKKFLETVRRYGNYYGTPKVPILRALKEGKNCLLNLEPVGVEKIKKLFPDKTVTILIKPPSLREIARRLTNRLPEEREKRLSEDKRIFASLLCDYSVLNKELKKAVAKITEIIKGELR